MPTGYSFNLDGTTLYVALSAIFVAQATNTPLSITDQLAIMAVLILSSKGAAGVTGAGFTTLVATLSLATLLRTQKSSLLVWHKMEGACPRS